MPESRSEQIVSKLQMNLAAIVADGGAAYWYTPTRVLRVVFFEDRQVDASQDCIYLIRPGEETHSEEATGGVIGEQEVFVVLLKRHEPPSDSAYEEQEPITWTVVNRLVRDFLKTLWSDVTLGGLAENVVADSIVIDRERNLPGWAVAEARFTVRYTYRAETP